MASTDPKIATQAQWEDLINTVKSVAGSVKELTSADYNYPTSGTATSVALWLLPPGIYYNATGATISESTTSTTTNSAYFIVDPVQNYSGTNYIQIYRFQSIVSTGKPILLTQVVAETGVLSVTKSVLLSDDIVDSLASSSSILALSARQGKVLNDKINAISNYSTTEVSTGTTWIDGSTIYKKTVETGALPNATGKLVPHDISNLSKVVKVEGYATNGAAFIPIGFPAIDTSNNVSVVVNSTDISITTGIDRSSYTESYVTIYYTKTS